MAPPASTILCLLAMFAKTLNFIAPLVLLVVACTTVQATNGYVDAWCECGAESTTSVICSDIGANYDGGSCGTTNDSEYNAFNTICFDKTGGASASCWN